MTNNFIQLARNEMPVAAYHFVVPKAQIITACRDNQRCVCLVWVLSQVEEPIPMNLARSGQTEGTITWVVDIPRYPLDT